MDLTWNVHKDPPEKYIAYEDSSKKIKSSEGTIFSTKCSKNVLSNKIEGPCQVVHPWAL